MKPLEFYCQAVIPISPEQIAAQVRDVANWSSFQGYGPLPAIREAVFECKTLDFVGSRIRVTNADGSHHVEQIEQWHPARRLQLRMHEFSPPLSRLATHFIETWEFRAVCTDEPGSKISRTTHVTRTLQLYAHSRLTRVALVPIAWLLKKAIARHLQQIGHARFADSEPATPRAD